MLTEISVKSTQKTLVGIVLGVLLLLVPKVGFSATTESATLQWAANSETDLAGYRVYQGTSPGVYGLSQDVGKITGHTATNLQAGMTYYFAVTAYDFSGNESVPSSEVYTSIPNGSLDVTPPSLAFTSPSDGSILSGKVAVSATATDDTGVMGVQFRLNGNNLGSEDTTDPYTITWDTTGLTPGSYILTAIARDAAGNATTSDPITVQISSPVVSTLTVSIVGNGTVTSSPTGIQCTSGTCSSSYSGGKTVALTAKADKRWKFVGWSGACSGTGECVVQLSTDQGVGAAFSQNGSGGGNNNGRKK